MQPLTSPATSKSFTLSVQGQDVAPAEGVVVSGVAWYDVYVSVDQSAFTLWQSLRADNPTAVFTGESGRKYGFRSLARDAAGNVEVKPLASDAWTIVPDLDPPVTQVNTYTVDTDAAVIYLNFSGTDTGGSGLASFQLYVEVDGGAAAWAWIDSYAAGTPSGGVYSGTATYAALVDGQQHTYRFYTVGIDGRGNIEAAPEAPADVLVSATFHERSKLAVIGLDVQQGAAQRSYIRYLDVYFDQADGIQDIIDSLSGQTTDRLALMRHDLNGLNPVDVLLTPQMLSLETEDDLTWLQIDFGARGIAGDPNSVVGNGYYRLSIDVDNDADHTREADLYFYRLAGDTNGDRRVDSLDLLAVSALLASGGYDRDADVNGDGAINTLDRLLVMRGRNQALAPGLPLDD
jgi:hypothetical protein